MQAPRRFCGVARQVVSVCRQRLHDEGRMLRIAIVIALVGSLVARADEGESSLSVSVSPEVAWLSHPLTAEVSPFTPTGTFFFVGGARPSLEKAPDSAYPQPPPQRAGRQPTRHPAPAATAAVLNALPRRRVRAAPSAQIHVSIQGCGGTDIRSPHALFRDRSADRQTLLRDNRWSSRTSRCDSVRQCRPARGEVGESRGAVGIGTADDFTGRYRRAVARDTRQLGVLQPIAAPC